MTLSSETSILTYFPGLFKRAVMYTDRMKRFANVAEAVRRLTAVPEHGSAITCVCSDCGLN